MNMAIEKMLNNKPDKELVKYHFLTQFDMVQTLGPLEALTLQDWKVEFQVYEAIVAYFFLGAVWGLSANSSNSLVDINDPFELNSAYDAWNWVIKQVKNWPD